MREKIWFFIAVVVACFAILVACSHFGMSVEKGEIVIEKVSY